MFIFPASGRRSPFSLFMMKLCIVGVGLIGSSFALGLRQRTPLNVLGVDRSADNLSSAQALGAIDRSVSLEEGVAEADVIVLAIPVNHIVDTIASCLSQMRADAVLVDMGSTKEAIVAQVRSHPRRGRYVAAHPIAGREKSGPTAARADLMVGKPMIVCDPDDSDEDARQTALTLFQTLEMKVSFADAAAHDLRLAYTSHLPHLLAFALSNTILNEAQRTEMVDSAGGGLKSVIRLALHSADMWTPIFEQNQGPLIEATDKLIAQLSEIRNTLEASSTEAVYRWVARANDIEKLLSK